MVTITRACPSAGTVERSLRPTDSSAKGIRLTSGVLPRPSGVAPSPLPRLEGTVPLSDGRRLAYAEFGAPHGPLVLWFHGTPGARRQVPPAAPTPPDPLVPRSVSAD